MYLHRHVLNSLASGSCTDSQTEGIRLREVRKYVENRVAISRQLVADLIDHALVVLVGIPPIAISDPSFGVRLLPLRALREFLHQFLSVGDLLDVAVAEVDVGRRVDRSCKRVDRLPLPDGVIVLEHITRRIDDLHMAAFAAGRLVDQSIGFLAVVW